MEFIETSPVLLIGNAPDEDPHLQHYLWPSIWG